MIAFTLDRQYHRLWKNAPSDSKELFGDDFTKRMTITNKKFSKLHQEITILPGIKIQKT